MSDVERLLDELMPVPEPPDVRERVLARLHGKPPRRSRIWLWAAATMGVAALLFVLVRRPIDLDGEVMAQTRQTVDLGGRAAAALEPGAALTWSVRGPRARVAQPRGSVFYRVERGGPFRVTTPAGAVEVTGTCFRVDAGSPATLVAVLEGSVRVEGDRGFLALTAGQTGRLVPGEAPTLVVPPSVEALGARAERVEARLRQLEDLLAAKPKLATKVAPRPAALVLPWSTTGLTVHGGAGHVSLGVPAGRGRVEVASDAGFAHRIFWGPAEGFVTVPMPREGDLYWRTGGAIAHARFVPEPRSSSTPPRNVVTDARASTSIYYQGAAPEVTLAGKPPILVLRAEDRTAVYTCPPGDRCTIPAGTLPGGRYLWTSAAGERALQLIHDQTPPSTLVIDRTIRAGREVEVTGAAPAGAQLSINGRPAALDPRGRFALRVSPAPLLVFQLRAPSGETSYWLRRM